MHKTLAVRSWAEHWSNLRRSKEGQRPQATMLNIVNTRWWNKTKTGKKGGLKKGKKTMQIDQKLIYIE